MVEKKNAGVYLAAIGSIILMIAGFAYVGLVIMQEIQIQLVLIPQGATVTRDYTLMYLKIGIMLSMAVVGIICAILIKRDIKAGAIIAIPVGIFILISAYIPSGIITFTITGIPLVSGGINPWEVTLGGTLFPLIPIEPILISVGGILGLLGLREG